MGQDEWFDEEADAFEIPSDEKKGKRPAKRRRPEPDEWEDDEPWDSALSDLPY